MMIRKHVECSPEGLKDQTQRLSVLLQRKERALKLELDPLELKQAGFTNLKGQLLTHLQHPYEILLHLLSQLTPDEAQWWSRGKAFINTPISPAHWGLMKVAGKRLLSLNTEQFNSLEDRLVSDSGVNLTTLLVDDFKLLYQAHFEKPDHAPEFLVESSHYFDDLKSAKCFLSNWVQHENQRLNQTKAGEQIQTGRRWAGRRRVVGALALDHKGQLLGMTLNHPQLSVTAHAEWCLLDQLERLQRWPSSGEVTLISSLKPCKMCAGAWVTHAPYQKLSVHYLRDDPGANGQNTAFDTESYAYQMARSWRNSWGSLSQVDDSSN